MKKKIILLIIAILILIVIPITIFFLTNCSNEKTPEKGDENTMTNNNSAIIYFSATGTTKKIAERIARYSNSDLIEIIPKEKYTSADLDYNSDCRANREQNDNESRPEIENKIDISKYDAIYLGYPIWWGTNPKIILTLLDSYDFSGKTIFPFCTSGSSGIETSVQELRNYNSNLNIKDGKRFSSSSIETEIVDFVNRSKTELNVQDKDASSMKVTINGTEYTINLEKNDTAKRLYELAPFEVTMKELNGNEKYIYLSDSFPINSYKPEHIKQGDVMLFDNSCLVIFYKTFDTPYSYSKIGHIDNLPDLGNESIIAKFEH